jgi:predicted Zn-dependent peptidase
LEFLRHTLPNGLEVIAEANDEAHSTAVGFFVQTGARDESDDVAGVSHFLEHMVFKGTPSRSADDVNREFDEMGAHYNAFTSEENTVYYASVLPEYQTASVDLLGDIMRPSLREEDFTTEKQVILEEIQMYDDQPPFGADDKCKALHFGRHPLARSVLGTLESVGQLPVDKMRAYFEKRYSPSNISLVAAGRVDFAELVRAAERRCGSWQPTGAGRDTTRGKGERGFQCLHKESATLEYVLQLANGPAATDEDRYAAKVLATILGDDSGSRLYWALVDSGLAEQASLSHYDYQGTGLFMTYMCCEAQAASGNLARVADIYRRAQQDGVTDAELSQAKSKINSRVVLSSERPRGRLFTVGGNWLNRQEYRTVRDDLEAIEKISREDIAAVLKKYPLSESTTVAIGPLKDMPAPK